MLSDPKRLKTSRSVGYLVSWKHKLRVRSPEEASALAARILADPANLEQIRAGLGRAEATEEELYEWLATGLASQGLVALKTKPRVPTFDPPEEVNLTDLLPVDGPSEPVAPVRTWFELRVSDELGQPIPGLDLSFMVEGRPLALTTNAQGIARCDGVETSFATAQFSNRHQLHHALTALWDQPRDATWAEDDGLETTSVRALDPVPSIGLRGATPHTVIFRPLVARARLFGSMFELHKSFLLPAAVTQVRRLLTLYETHPRADLVIAGHTDATGSHQYNDPLSLERAEALRAFLTDAVDAWLAWFEVDRPPAKRWGSHEEQLMLEMVLLSAGLFDPANPVREYQELRGLEVDGVIGPHTRRQLVADYMATDGTTLPDGIDALVHGCGENFPLDRAFDENLHEDASDRRVEVFFFDAPLGVLPRVEDSTHSCVSSDPYPQWRMRAKNTSDFIARHNRRLAVKAVDQSSEKPIIDAKVELINLQTSAKRGAQTDHFGVVVFDEVEAATYTIAAESSAHVSSQIDVSVATSDSSSGHTVKLAPAVGAIAVTVLEAGGGPLSSIDVRLEGPLEGGVTTNGKGAALFENIPAGVYDLKVEHAGFAPFVLSVQVEPNSTRPVEITLVSTAPLQYELEELVESVTRGGKLGTVNGATPGSRYFGSVYTRKDKKGSAFKQYVNLDQDTHGASSRRPDQGRELEFWAKLTWVHGDKTTSLADRTVNWAAKVTPHPGPGRPSSFKEAGERPGFGGTTGKLTATSTTDKEGWAKITFNLSQYAGDEFKIEARVDSSDSHAKASGKSSAPYVVWRRFWYELTQPKNSSVPVPSKSIAAYEAVGADMLLANSHTFTKATAPKRTFYPEGMLKIGSTSTTDKAVIGRHNQAHFTAMMKKEARRPVKGHLVVCDDVWMPSESPTVFQEFHMTSKTQEVKLNLPKPTCAILKPALKGSVVARAFWTLDPIWIAAYKTGAKKTPPEPSKLSGPIDDSHISIPLPRTRLDKVTVTLPADAPDPTKYRVFVALSLNFARRIGGVNFGEASIAGYTGSNAAFFQAVAHEFGHGFNQVPGRPAKTNTSSLGAHPNHYDETDKRGGVGPHCSTGTTVTPTGRYDRGTCIMFHNLSPATCTQTFCSDCEPHLRLEPMRRFR